MPCISSLKIAYSILGKKVNMPLWKIVVIDLRKKPHTRISTKMTKILKCSHLKRL